MATALVSLAFLIQGLAGLYLLARFVLIPFYPREELVRKAIELEVLMVAGLSFAAVFMLAAGNSAAFTIDVLSAVWLPIMITAGIQRKRAIRRDQTRR